MAPQYPSEFLLVLIFGLLRSDGFFQGLHTLGNPSQALADLSQDYRALCSVGFIREVLEPCLEPTIICLDAAAPPFDLFVCGNVLFDLCDRLSLKNCIYIV